LSSILPVHVAVESFDSGKNSSISVVVVMFVADLEHCSWTNKAMLIVSVFTFLPKLLLIFLKIHLFWKISWPECVENGKTFSWVELFTLFFCSLMLPVHVAVECFDSCKNSSVFVVVVVGVAVVEHFSWGEETMFFVILLVCLIFCIGVFSTFIRFPFIEMFLKFLKIHLLWPVSWPHGVEHSKSVSWDKLVALSSMLPVHVAVESFDSGKNISVFVVVVMFVADLEHSNWTNKAMFIVSVFTLFTKFLLPLLEIHLLWPISWPEGIEHSKSSSWVESFL
jgi:hypothetical protein